MPWRTRRSRAIWEQDAKIIYLDGDAGEAAKRHFFDPIRHPDLV